MPQGSSAIDEARSLLQARLAELDAERTRVEKALADLDSGTARRRPGRPRGTTTKRRRRRRGGTRGEQAVKHVKGSPGITASEIAKKMGIKPNYLYRVMSELESEGRVTKKGREYHPA